MQDAFMMRKKSKHRQTKSIRTKSFSDNRLHLRDDRRFILTMLNVRAYLSLLVLRHIADSLALAPPPDSRNPPHD